MARTNFRLTKKTALELVKREFGISGKLVTEKAGHGVYIYKMDMGRFEVTVSNDWYEQNGLVSMWVRHDGGTSIHLYFQPETLEEDCQAEYRDYLEELDRLCGER